jgi:HSP20 family protein
MFNLIPWKKREPSRALAFREDHPLTRFRDEFDALFDRFLARWPAPFDPGFDLDRSWGFDMEENDREVVVRAEVPGFEAGDLDVQVSGQVLTIQAEKKEGEGKEGNGRRRSYRSYRRTLTLPPGADPAKIEARYHNGVLEVHVPRGDSTPGKRVPVKT